MNGRGIYGDVLSAQMENKSGPHDEKTFQKFGKETLMTGRISSCISEQIQDCRKRFRKGSLSIEAALVLPVFWYGISGFLYLFLFFRLHEDIAQTLADAGREMGRYVYQEEAAETGLVKNLGILQVKQELRERCADKAALQVVEGGISGIHLWMSDILEHESKIELVASYRLRTPWVLLGFDGIPVIQRQICRSWVGYKGDVADGESEEMVYITPSGMHYHLDFACRYLRLSIQTISGSRVAEKRNANGERYRICENCCQEGIDELIYVTEYGNRYHESLQCSGLKRTVCMVALSEVQSRTLCAGCGSSGNE